jgi:ribosomal protein L11 methyltransferase
MPWSELIVSVAREEAPVAELVLQQFGALAVTFEDDADQAVLEPPPGATPLWPAIRLRGLFEADVDRARVMAALESLPSALRGDDVHWRVVEDRDWERAWMDRFAPMRFGRHLWIVPSGMDIARAAEDIVIHLDPGLAFGTGTHPTTALCLEWIDGQRMHGQTVVDYGCGSGVLGIGAALKGAARVICVDNDPQALEATAANAARNAVADRLLCAAPEELSIDHADVVLANILAGPLVELAPVLLGALRSGGRLVLSGILDEQADRVRRAYRTAAPLVPGGGREGWLLLTGRKAPESVPETARGPAG